MDENILALVRQLGPQILTVVAALGGAFITLRASARIERFRVGVEDRRRSEDLRIGAIERSASLLQTDGVFMQRQLRKALQGESREIDQDPGLEAVSLLRIYFPDEVKGAVDLYAEHRNHAIYEFSQCTIYSILAKNERQLFPKGDVKANQEELMVHREAAFAHLKSMSAPLNEIIIRLSEIMKSASSGRSS